MCESSVSQNPPTWTLLSQCAIALLMALDTSSVKGSTEFLLDDEETAENRYLKKKTLPIPSLAQFHR